MRVRVLAIEFDSGIDCWLPDMQLDLTIFLANDYEYYLPSGCVHMVSYIQFI